jgi:spore coat polysaccharide biosynthesis protein SpsF (cytidylyltransferase family)
MNESIEKIPVFVTVRSSSSRLPEKCFLSFGKGSVLEHVIQRSIYYDLDPVVCTTTNVEDDAIVELAKKYDVKFYRGPAANKLLRWSQCCEYFELESFHSVDADDPFFDGDEIKSSMKMLQEENLDMVCPTESSSAGGASVGYSLTADIVKRSCKGLDKDADTEMMWYHMEKIPDLKTKILPETRKSISNMRLTLDYEEDYWLLESVRRMVGNLASRDKVDRLFLSNPDLYKINWFRNDEWKAGQLSKKI